MAENKIDVDALVAGIQAEVERKKSAGAYSPELLQRLEISLESPALDPPELYCLIQSYHPIRSRAGLLGKSIVFGKRVIRRMVAWYVTPMAQDQTNFNTALLREFRQLQRRVEELERRN